MRCRLLVLAVLLASGSVSLWGCPKKADVSATAEAQQQKQRDAALAEEEARRRAAADREAAERQQLAREQEERERAAAAGRGLQPVHFDYDQSVIRDDARATLKANAEWLKANPKARIRIEGNCDERGTIEYNQALGQRRAQAVKNYLAGLGIAAARMSLLSYGKDKPVCTDGTESCWQKNRRADFAASSN